MTNLEFYIILGFSLFLLLLIFVACCFFIFKKQRLVILTNGKTIRIGDIKKTKKFLYGCSWKNPPHWKQRMTADDLIRLNEIRKRGKRIK